MMRLRTLASGAAICAVIVGCETADNIRKGATTPLAPGETSVFDKAKDDAAPFSGLPYGLGTVMLGLFAAYRLNERGRSIKAGKIGTSPVPVSGWLGQATRLEPVIQAISNVFAGAYEVGPDGSVKKRSWKVLLSLAAPAALLAVPQVRDFVMGNAETINEVIAQLSLYLGGGAVVLLGAEKGLSAVKPMPESAAPTS